MKHRWPKKPRNSMARRWRAHRDQIVERQAILSRLGVRSYREYLESPLWRSIRARVLAENPQCCRCGAVAYQVHHHEYTEANLSGASLVGLFACCYDCHRAAETTTTGNRRTARQATARLLGPLINALRSLPNDEVTS